MNKIIEPLKNQTNTTTKIKPNQKNNPTQSKNQPKQNNPSQRNRYSERTRPARGEKNQKNSSKAVHYGSASLLSAVDVKRDLKSSFGKVYKENEVTDSINVNAGCEQKALRNQRTKEKRKYCLQASRTEGHSS